ncbi:MAG TPA: carboxypeptidase-like regulatory domain-containing protein [Acidobacteriaceae bacterium]|nr:carboxypeptidase-like regulatory domain-containing protein [Acidobacteriaceae bacterium]
MPSTHAATSALLALFLSAAAFCQAPAPPAEAAPPPAAATTQVTGSVLDPQGDAVSGANITLIPTGKLTEHTATSGADGSFAVQSLPASQYRLTIMAPGFALYASGEFTVRPGESVTLPAVTLKASSTTTNVSVVASANQIAAAQVHMEEQQRVLGVFQNYYTSYIWDAAPMPAKEKYKLALRSLVDPPQFLVVAGVAGAEHFNGTYPGYGPGIEGYGKRYGAALADATTSRIVGSAILPSLLHQDPRYFYQGSGSVPSRALHAVSFTFIARGDNGRNQPNYSHLLGSLAAAGVANTYHPAGSRGVGDTFQAFGVNLAANIVGNLVREFVLRNLESIPTFANGKH